jgi:hypothetical protein
MSYLVEAWERDGKGVARYAHIRTDKAVAVSAFADEHKAKPKCALITLTRPGSSKYAGEYTVYAVADIDQDLVPARDWHKRELATAARCPHCGGEIK